MGRWAAMTKASRMRLDLFDRCSFEVLKSTLGIDFARVRSSLKKLASIVSC